MPGEMRDRIKDIVAGRQEYPVNSKSFWLPNLEQVASYVELELRKNYSTVSVEVVECPDLTQFGCPAPGLTGDAKLIEGGGEPFNHDTDYNREVHFQLERMAGLAGHHAGSFLFGAAAAGVKQLEGHIGELVPCMVLQGENRTKAVRVDSNTRNSIVEQDSTKLCGGISNLFVSQGKAGKVLKVSVSGRTGDQISFTQNIRAGLRNIPEVGAHRQIGMGGVFRMKSGQVKAHVNPDFEVLPDKYYDRDQMKCVKDFLQFYKFDAPLLCFTTLWSDEPTSPTVALNLRSSGEHTHFWKEEGSTFSNTVGGHYHGDLTPEEASYEGYFSLASQVVRVWDAVQQKMDDI